MTGTLLPIPTASLPRFDEVYAISDLHLGGRTGFQIFSSGKELVRLLEHLTSLKTARKVALVINGDFVDFLAESPPVHFDPVHAADKLSRIASDAAFSPVFDALRTFTATKNRYLAVTLGNHDLELALPWVREHLLDLLSGENEAARGRITLAFDGSGFLCMVGTVKVLCVHGNEVDNWNLTDHETIRRIGRDMAQGKPVESWIPNAGTQLVIDVMNEVKKRYPFVDLLKPEEAAVVPTLLALDPSQNLKLNNITRGLASQLRRQWDALRRRTGFLGNGELREELLALEAAMPLAHPGGVAMVASAVSLETSRDQFANDLLRATEARLNDNIQPMELVSLDQQEGYLGGAGAIWNLVTRKETSEVLREALEKLQHDRSFELKQVDQTFTDLDKEIGGDIDFLVAGHTHHERALERKKGRGWYYNSGTWVRLIKLEEEVLRSKDKFSKVFQAFKAGTMDALDASPGLVKRISTVVAITSDDAGTTGQLYHVTPNGAAVLAPVKDSLFSKK